MKAWIENGAVRDTCHGNPETLYHPDVARFYDTDVPDGIGVVIGATQNDGMWINPSVPEPPAYVEPEPAAPAVPQSVTMRQARLALLAAGLLPAVTAAIAAAGDAAQIEWEYANEVLRVSGLVPAMATALGMTETQIDELFIAADAL